MGSRKTALSGATVALVLATATACSSRHGDFGGTSTAASALGVYPASSSMTQKYGIVEWHEYVGKTQIVITGYRADHTAARGVQIAWFTATPNMPAHTRLAMLDGTGAAIRRMVGGGKTGKLSPEQAELLDAVRYDLQRSTTGLHSMDDTMSGGTTPNSGPGCTSAWADPNIAVDAAGCAEGAATFETVVGGVVAILSCSQWYLEAEQAKSTCDQENAQSCTGDQCDFSQEGSQSQGSGSQAAPQQQCDSACLCANYPQTAQGCGTVGPCSDDSECTNGETCQAASYGSSSKICGAPAADPVTDENTSTTNDAATSCGSGDVSADTSNGQVSCSGDSSGSSGSSGGPSGSSGGDTSGGTDTPTDPGSSGGDTSGGTSGGGDTCANDGDACAQDADCCNGTCSNGTCGAASGGSCANDGDPCAQDSDCCNGTCSGGTCGSSGGTCGNPGDPCGSDTDCCSGSCDLGSGTCN